MSDTLHQFGRVLFDELEQVAVRRGGFASLKWVKENLEKAKLHVEELGKKAADSNVVVPSLSETADECARQARDALALATQTAEAVEQLRQIVWDMVKTAQEVPTKMTEPPVGVGPDIPWGPLGKFVKKFRRAEDRKDWKDRMTKVKLNLAQHAESCRDAQEALKVLPVIRDQNEKFILEARVARDSSNPQDNNEHVTRDAVVLRSRDLASALGTAARQFDQVITAFQTMAKVKKGPVVELGRMVAEQSAASRYEIYDLVEDAARKSAMRMETVGLAFSGGGIRSATFNLGFLQGAAARGLLKQFDYLSTVSGGGYIGAWFAAWVLREGGRQPKPPTDAGVVRELAALVGAQQEEAKARFQKRYDAEVVEKRRGTSQALENVQMQLDSSRAAQGRADRRWAWPVDNPPPPFRRPLEEEPEPVHHLREHSNYLAPKLGLLSINTWTMVSVYLRNLFLNQFILLPMMLAVIALPRLLLLLFTHSTSQPMVPLARAWLDRQNGWPVPEVLFVAIVAAVILPERVDSLGRRIGGWVREWIAGLVMLVLLGAGMWALAIDITAYILWLIPPNSRRIIPTLVRSLARNLPWANGLTVLLLSALAVAIGYRRAGNLAKWAAGKPHERARAWAILSRRARNLARWDVGKPHERARAWAMLSRHARNFAKWAARERHERARGWAILYLLLLGITWLVGWLLPPLLYLVELLPSWWLTGDLALFLVTLGTAWFGFHWTYKTMAQIRESRRLAPGDQADYRARFVLTEPFLRWRIVMPLTLVSFGVSLLFARPEEPFFVWPLPSLSGWFDWATGNWGGMKFWLAVCFGALVGLMRALSSLRINWKDWSRTVTPIALLRAHSAFSSGLISGAGLAAVLWWLRGQGAAHPGGLGAVMMSFGPALVMVAIGAGSAIEVGLIGGYGEEDLREWRASLGAYLLIIGTLWAALSVLSVYGPLFLWWAGSWAAWAAGAAWLVASLFGALASRSERTDGVRTSKSPLEYVAVIAPPVFIIGLVVAVSVLVAALQDVHIPITGDGPLAGQQFLHQLSYDASPELTWTVVLASAFMAIVGFVHANINLFGLNAFYANRLVRCYLGASRPREEPAEERPNFAPTNSPGPVRRPNPITGFDPDDDFPLRDLAIVRSWDGDDLVVDYRGPYHLINTAMNLGAGRELAWQERKAESFILSPLYCGSKTTGFRRANTVRRDLDDDEIELWDVGLADSCEVDGYGDDIRLGTAISVSGAAASPNAGYRSSPLARILMMVLNARLGLWLGNPARSQWRRSGPKFAFYFLDELIGRTTSEKDYVYLSDGGHFENLGAYELVRRRCRYIVVCDAGADPGLSFWDLGSLVRKCRQDFGIRIEIDISPLLKQKGTPYAKWHCAVGQIHYDEVDDGAPAGTLIYIKPSLSGDEPSDVRNYVVDHPTFPHESTADQFFSESRFESYRELGEHIALDVFPDAGPDSSPATLFSGLRRRTVPEPKVAWLEDAPHKEGRTTISLSDFDEGLLQL